MSCTVTWELNMHREVSKEIVLERTVSIGYRNRPVTSTNMHMSS